MKEVNAKTAEDEGHGVRNSKPVGDHRDDGCRNQKDQEKLDDSRWCHFQAWFPRRRTSRLSVIFAAGPRQGVEGAWSKDERR